ncbi:hypothetical protein B0T10DRAFT_296089 [Thelonectria olida]|uniref:Uncharacterized protein n=1 Tax=Thelonectria olida TaxID=1576542 RepID=A0A9P8VRB6_9HYPO|nr:hypothetical protein B0T10DRAFT_296089 [Thelonectria olida]
MTSMFERKSNWGFSQAFFSLSLTGLLLSPLGLTPLLQFHAQQKVNPVEGSPVVSILISLNFRRRLTNFLGAA